MSWYIDPLKVELHDETPVRPARRNRPLEYGPYRVVSVNDDVTSGTNTMPYCGECGWDTRLNVNYDQFCDSCGTDLRMFGYAFTPTLIGGAFSDAFSDDFDTGVRI